MKNVVIIEGSPRKGGNSDRLAGAFATGAMAAGNAVEKIELRDYNLGYCHGCYHCVEAGECFQKDGMNEIIGSLLKADVIVLATPVYFYSVSGQMKVFIDRLVSCYRKIHADIYLLCTAADPGPDIENAFATLRGLTKLCLVNCTEKGAVAVGGVKNVGDILEREELRKVYDMGYFC